VNTIGMFVVAAFAARAEPVGAFLAEFFPGRIRYTSVSVPYHIGNGWGGGLVPFITSAAFASTGSIGYALHACSVTFAAHCGHRWLPLGMGVRGRGCGDCNRRRAGRAASLEAYRPLQRERAAGKARQDSRQAFGGGFHVQD
jgi:hypothetical protein